MVIIFMISLAMVFLTYHKHRDGIYDSPTAMEVLSLSESWGWNLYPFSENALRAYLLPQEEYYALFPSDSFELYDVYSRRAFENAIGELRNLFGDKAPYSVGNCGAYRR